MLYRINEQLLVYLCGLFALTLFLGIYYYRRSGEYLYSLLSPLLGMLAYFMHRY